MTAGHTLACYGCGVNKVAQLRKKRRLSQAALAKAAGTSQQQIARIEAGQSPQVELAGRIASVLGAYPEEVFALPRVAEHDRPAFSEITERGLRLLEKLPAETVRKRHGQFAAVDVDSGEVFFSRSDIKATRAAHAARPNARVFLGRVGHVAIASFSSP